MFCPTQLRQFVARWKLMKRLLEVLHVIEVFPDCIAKRTSLRAGNGCPAIRCACASQAASLCVILRKRAMPARLPAIPVQSRWRAE